MLRRTRIYNKDKTKGNWSPLLSSGTRRHPWPFFQSSRRRPCLKILGRCHSISKKYNLRLARVHSRYTHIYAADAKPRSHNLIFIFCARIRLPEIRFDGFRFNFVYVTRPNPFSKKCGYICKILWSAWNTVLKTTKKCMCFKINLVTTMTVTFGPIH